MQKTFDDLEDFGFAVGDADDWVSRSVLDITDWVDDLREGKITTVELKRRIRERFREAQDNLDDWRLRFGWKAKRHNFPYLNPELRLAVEQSVPFMRIVKSLPKETA